MLGKNFLGSVVAAMMGASHFALPQLLPVSAPRGSVKRRNKTTAHKRHGAREVNRRLRQVANGQLTRSNGLRTAEELGLVAPAAAAAKPARKPRARKAA